MEIKSIRCPCCDGNLYKIRDTTSGGQGGNEFIWKCGHCVHFYPEQYFDVYKQFEHLVVRG